MQAKITRSHAIHKQHALKTISEYEINSNAFFAAISKTADDCAHNISESFEWLAKTLPGIWNGIVSGFHEAFKDIEAFVNRITHLGAVISGSTDVVANAQNYLDRGKSKPVPVGSVKPMFPNAGLNAGHNQGWSWWNHLWGYAGGTDFARGGPSCVGERGPELVNLPRGSQVVPNHKLGGGGIHIHAGAIVINQRPGQSNRDLANEVIRSLGKVASRQALSSPDQPLLRFG